MKVEVAVLDSPSLIVLTVSVDVNNIELSSPGPFAPVATAVATIVS